MSEPPVTVRAAHDSGPGNLPPYRVVIHATCPNVGYPAASAPGTALGTARYFASANAKGSAHYVCDPGAEQHCVPDNYIAWHAPPNPHSIGIEICSEGGDYPKSYTRDQWLSSAVWPAVLRAAQRTRELCIRHRIPLVRVSAANLRAGAHGICGHVDVSHAYGQSSHSDPGSAFPWAEFMNAVTLSNATGDDMNLGDPLPDYYTSKQGDTLSVGNTMAWGTAHAANARDRATEARDAARATGLALAAMRGELDEMKAQLATIVAILAKKTP